VLELNYLYRQTVLKTLRILYEGYARLRGRRFRCKTLSGEALFGCYFNSDMTVSCNCQDFDGSGQLGSLRENTFEELFTGGKAMRLRQALAAGRLPLSRCAACFSMETARPEIADKDMSDFRLPKGVCIENTILCNLRCRSCCRLQVMKTRSGGHCLSLQDVETIGRTLQRLKAKFCGYYNLGEPFFSPNIRRELEIVRNHNPGMEIFISTNGVLIDNAEKRAAALVADHIVFSIDGVSTKTVRRYQRGGDFDKAYRNMKDLVSLRDSLGRTEPYIGWKYVVFRWNDRPADIRELLRLAREAGVDYIQMVFARTPWYGMSWRFFSPFFRSVAKRQWRNRFVWFRKPGRDLTGLPPDAEISCWEGDRCVDRAAEGESERRVAA
jgi:pyruvate-formate lyase-activating enzyme